MFANYIFWIWISLYCSVNAVAPSSKGVCSKPSKMSNAELRDQFRTKDMFQENDFVEYDCNIGYQISGPSRSITCRNGQWSEALFECVLNTCPFLEHPINGRRKDKNYSPGKSTIFECDEGYKLVGNGVLQCRVDGQWLPDHPPTCIPVLCPELSRIKNGKLFQESKDKLRNSYNSTAEYTCNYQYRFAHSPALPVYTKRCQLNGEWDGVNPECIISTCPEPEPVYGGRIWYTGDRKAGSVAYVVCNQETDRIPNIDSIDCVAPGYWENELPKCYRTASAVCQVALFNHYGVVINRIISWQFIIESILSWHSLASGSSDGGSLASRPSAGSSLASESSAGISLARESPAGSSLVRGFLTSGTSSGCLLR